MHSIRYRDPIPKNNCDVLPINRHGVGTTLAFHVPAVQEAIDSFVAPFILIDTPGQIELFAFREASRSIVNQIGFESSCLFYLMDPMLARTASGYVTQLMLSNTVQFRLMLPMHNVLSKVDLLKEVELEQILAWGENPDRLYDDLLAQTADMDREYAISHFRVFEQQNMFKDVIPTSAEKDEGMEDLYSFVQSVLAGGEDVDIQTNPDFRD